jgi:DNA repair protein RadA/Sms
MSDWAGGYTSSMAKTKTVFYCSNCGAEAAQWSGQCSGCGEWNTLSETTAVVSSKQRAANTSYAGPGQNQVRLLDEVLPDAIHRVATGMQEFDRVLGGGLVPGSVTLIGGDPGIGKSTLLLQALVRLSQGHPTLYVTGEESLQQVSLRASRLGYSNAKVPLLASTQIETIIKQAEKSKPGVIVIDSIQTMFTDELTAAPGAVSQVRECAARLVRYAKQTQTAVFLVGHVTKEGTLAGPRVLEHMVDTVLYFEGDSGQRYRLIRAVKNRFGAINELGVFAMTDKGLREVSNPSAIFLSRHQQAVPGSVIMVTLEGSRPLLVEVQALVDESQLANPRRVTVGFEHNRLAMLLAVLHRHGDIVTGDQDVFANVVGGVRVTETGADLAVLLAVMSSLRNRTIARDMIVFGEVGLAGEIRPVPNGQERLMEACKHGYKKALIPAANAPQKAPEGMEIIAVDRIAQALDVC